MESKEAEEDASATPLVAELKKRRKALLARSVLSQLEATDLITHFHFVEMTSRKMVVQREEISRKHKITSARVRRTKHDVAKISALTTKGAKLEQAAEEFNVNVAALKAEREWLEATDAWKNIMANYNENWVTTASGEVIEKKTLEQDEEEFGSFEDYLAAFKDPANDVPRL